LRIACFICRGLTLPIPGIMDVLSVIM
jgi:hypothetical protein